MDRHHLSRRDMTLPALSDAGGAVLPVDISVASGAQGARLPL